MSVDFQLFKENLNKRGLNWSDQKILDYISVQEDKKITQPIMQSDLGGEIFNIVKKFEYNDSARSQRHNNPGGHTWNLEREAKYGAKKGESFQSQDEYGNKMTLYTAKYDTYEQGEKASIAVTNNIINNTIKRYDLKPNDPGFGEAFAKEYTRNSDPKVIRNYGGDIQNAISDYTNNMPQTAPQRSVQSTNMQDKLSAMSQASSVYKPLGYEEPKGAAADFIGNFLWNAADLSTFGLLDYLDVDEFVFGKEYGEEPGQAAPSTFAGRVGAGLGGFAGFLTPFGLTKGAVGAGIKGLSKYGTSAAAKNIAKEGAEFLGKKAGVSKQGYKKFQNLPIKEQNKFMDFLYGEGMTASAGMTSIASSIASKKGKDLFVKSWNEGSNRIIREQFKKYGIRATDSNVSQIKNIVDKTLGLSNKSVQPITNLQQRIAIALGGTPGAGKLATIASHTIEEGLLFAMVETPMEFFQALDQEREFDFTGRWKHAFLLGNALGAAKMIPGGLKMPDGQDFKIGRNVLKRWQLAGKNKKPYSTYLTDTQKQRDHLVVMARSLFKKVKNKSEFSDDVITTLDDIKVLGQTKAGGDKLKKVLSNLEKNWTARWNKDFIKEVSSDLIGSTPRMLAGSMVFNYEVVFAEEVPLEDKVFNFLLGAFMTKQGKRVDYVSQTGKTKTFFAERHKDVGKDFIDANTYLDLLGINPKVYNAQALYNASLIERKHLRNLEMNEDVQGLIKILNSENLVIKDDGTPIKIDKNAAAEGEFPIYEAMQNIFDGYLSGSGERMKGPTEISKDAVRKLEKKLAETNFKAAERGIRDVNHIDDIIYDAADTAMKDVINTHLLAANEIYNHLGGRQNRVIQEPGETASGKKILPDYLPISIEAGETLTAENRIVLDKYNRIVKTLNGRQLQFNEKHPKPLKVKNEDFQGLKEKIESYDMKVDELVNGTRQGPEVGRAYGLMEEGYLMDLIMHQNFYRGVRQIHNKMTDFDSVLWGDFSGSHDGKLAKDLIGKLFIGNDSVLISEFSTKGLSTTDARFVGSLLNLLRTDPNYEQRILTNTGSKVSFTTEQIRDIKSLRKVFRDNSMEPSLISGDVMESRMFESIYSERAMDVFFKGAVKKDGTILNSTDRKVLSKLMDFKLLTPNMDMVEIIGVINQMSSQLSNIDLKKLDLNSNNKMGKGWRVVVDTIFKNEPTMDKLFEQVAIEMGIEKQFLAAELFRNYKDVISPYLVTVNPKTQKQTGFIKTTSTIASLRPDQLSEIIQQVSAVKKSMDNVLHDSFLSKLDAIKNNSKFDSETRETLNWIHQMYNNRSVNSNEVIEALRKKGYYDIMNDKLIIDPLNKDLKKDMQEIYDRMKFDIAQGSEVANLESQMNHYRSTMSKASDIDLYKSVTRDAFKQKYSLDKDFDFSKDTSREKLIEDSRIYDESGKELKFEDMNSSQQFELMNDIQQLILGSRSQVNVQRLSISEGYGVHTDFKHTVMDNHVFREIVEIFGKDSFAIVDMLVAGKNNRLVNARGNPKMMSEIINRVALSKTSIDNKLRTDEWGTLVHEKGNGHIVIKLADLSWGIGVKRENVPKILELFESKVNEWESTYKDVPKSVFDSLKETLKISTKSKKPILDKDNKETGKFEYEWDLPDATIQSERLQTMFSFMFMDKNMGKHFWEHMKTETPESTAKYAGRLRLLANTAMKELSTDYIKETYDFYRTHASSKKINPEMIKGLKRINENEGLKIIVAADEQFTTGELTKGKSANILQELKAQIDAETKFDSKIVNEFGDNNRTWAGGGEVSKYDSYMAVGTETMQALYALSGAANTPGLGGIKPIIHRVGSNVIIGKTAFVADPRLDGMLKKNNLDAVMFGSASKIQDKSRFFTEWESFDDLAKLNLKGGKKVDMSKHVELLKGEDISIGSIVNSDHNATISHSALNHLSGGASRKAFNWLLRDNLENLIKESDKKFDSNNLVDGLAYSKYLMENMSVKDNASSYNRWIKANGLPQISTFSNQFRNQLKSNLIDKPGILSMKSSMGGQSVVSPGEKLLFTTFREKSDGTREVNTYGEAEIPFISGEKLIDVNNLHFVKRNSKGKDNIITLKEFEKETGNTSIAKGDRLVDAFLKIADNKDYQIMANFRRNPHTRPGDVSSIGIKNILAENYGNQVKLNAYDFAMRHEGDFDVDKLDFWWNTPKEVVKEWDALSGRVLRVNPDGPNQKTSLPKNLSFKDAASMNKFYEGDYIAQTIRGVIVKTPRLLNALKHYSSGGAMNTETGKAFAGLSLRIKSAEGGGKLYIDPVKMEKTLDQLATDIQNITDSRQGYNAEKYNTQWFDRVLFGDSEHGYEGVFSKATFNTEGKFKNTWTPTIASHEFTATEKAVIKAVIEPYSHLLGLATGKFSTGKREKISYDDILSQTRTFDSQMANLPQYVYWKVTKQKGIDKQELNRMFDRDKGKGFFNPFGNFGDAIRPNLARDTRATTKWMDNQLPFERAMSVISYHDNMKLESPGRIGGEMLSEFKAFSEKGMYSEDFSNTAKDFITELNKNNKFLGYVNYLDFRIRSQEKARYAAYGKDNKPYAEYLTEEISVLKKQKSEIENQMILGESGQAAPWAKGIREASKRKLVDDMIKEKRAPKGWAEGELPTSFDYATVSAWAKRNDNALNKYVGKNNIIRVEGVSSMEQLERLIWFNSFDRYNKIFINETIQDKRMSEDFEKDIKDFKSYYRNTWKNNFNGQEWYMDATRSNTVIMDKLERKFSKWQAEGGYGQLFLWKLMSPETESFKFTYVHDRLTPAFKKESLSMIRLGLNFISGADNKLFTEFNKDMIFSHLSGHVNNSLRAIYGLPGERGTVVHNTMSNAANMKHDIFRGFPLVDDIATYNFSDWSPSFQQKYINPGVSSLFGFDGANKNIAYHMSSQPLLPSFAAEMAKASYLHYMPVGYIPEFVGATKYGAINGGQSYLRAVENGFQIMLGDAVKQNLTYGGPKRVVHRQPYEGLPPVPASSGAEKLKGITNSKVGGEC